MGWNIRKCPVPPRYEAPSKDTWQPGYIIRQFGKMQTWKTHTQVVTETQLLKT